MFPLKKHFDRVNITMEGQMGEFDAAEDMFEFPELDSEDGVLPSDLPQLLKLVAISPRKLMIKKYTTTVSTLWGAVMPGISMAIR